VNLEDASTARRCWWIIAALMLVATSLRLLHLGTRVPWGDEMRSLLWARSDFAALIVNLKGDVHPLLYGAALHLWGSAFGLSWFSLRLFSAVLGVATIPLIFEAGRRWAGPATGLGAAVALTLSPFHVFYSQEARNYTLLGLVMLGSIYLLLRWLEERDGRWLVGHALLAAIAVHTHYWAFFVVAFANAYVFVRLPFADREAWIRWLGSQAVLGLLYVPWLPALPMQLAAGKGDWMRPPPYDAILKTMYRFSSGDCAPPSFPDFYRYVAVLPFLVVYVPLLALGALAPAGESAHEREWRHGIVAYLIVPLVIAFAFARFVKPFYAIGRFEMVVFPAYVLLMGRGLARLRPALAGSAVMALVLWMGVYLHYHHSYWGLPLQPRPPAPPTEARADPVASVVVADAGLPATGFEGLPSALASHRSIGQ
jgi:4-amino-4-deoxy-L-arabinose transferase-like glycosyltransferase